MSMSHRTGAFALVDDSRSLLRVRLCVRFVPVRAFVRLGRGLVFSGPFFLNKKSVKDVEFGCREQ